MNVASHSFESAPGDTEPRVAHGVRYRPGLHRFAVMLVVATFFLLVLGGTVTSKGVGLAVPDWPTTFGYHMFGVPLDLWIGRGGVFWEHAHRLGGTLIGLMSIIMAQWIWLPYLNRKFPVRIQRRWPWLCRVDPTQYRPDRPWLGGLALSALALVIIQGIMGGLRVTEVSTAWGVLHGVTAQVFFCVTVFIAAATSRWWIEAMGGVAAAGWPRRFSLGLRRLSLILLAVMGVQLVLGASMRHTGSRLAIPDFPSAYGRWIPPLTEGAIRAAIDEQPYEQFTQYYTPAQVGNHFAHRVWAMVVMAVAVWFLRKLGSEASADPRLAGPMMVLTGLLLAQLALGALVVWTGGGQANHEIATAHQATGAAILAVGVLLAVRVHILGPRSGPAGHQPQPIPSLKRAIA